MKACPLPRVLVATNMYPTQEVPAFGAFVRAQVDGLRGLGVETEVFQLHAKRSARQYLAAIIPLRRTVRHFRPDIVFAFYGLTGFVALWQPAPVVLSLAGDDVLGSPNARGGLTAKSRLIVGVSHWAAWHAAAVCVQSEEMRRRLWTADLRNRAKVIPYGVDPVRFQPGDQVGARRRLGLPADEPFVLWPNTPAEVRKRLDRAEAVMAVVRRAFPDMKMRIVSAVPHESMPDYYRAADCCLLTSDWEGSPNVVKEALLTGLPVVTTDVGDVRRWIAGAPESAVCSPNPEELGREVVRVLRSRVRVNPNVLRDAISTHAIAVKTLNVFHEVLSSDRRGNHEPAARS